MLGVRTMRDIQHPDITTIERDGMIGDYKEMMYCTFCDELILGKYYDFGTSCICPGCLTLDVIYQAQYSDKTALEAVIECVKYDWDKSAEFFEDYFERNLQEVS